MRCVLTLLVLATTSTACCREVRPDPLAGTSPPRATCADLPRPPELRPVRTTKPGDAGCPATFARCLNAAAAVDLAANVEALRAYADAAWTRCGSRVDADAPGVR